MKKVVIISSSLRTQSNSDLLAQAFAQGAEAAGHQAELISLRDKELKFCKGCLACQTNKKCVISDDASALLDTVGSADVLVLATPIYYYAVCGQLKTFLDRMNPLFAAGHHYRSVYLLATAAEDAASAVDGAIKEVQGFIDCFDGVELKGVLRATGLTEAGAASDRPDYLSRARKMGEDVS